VGRGRHYLPLRHLVDGVDVVHAFDSLQVTPMDRVDPQENLAGPADRAAVAP